MKTVANYSECLEGLGQIVFMGRECKEERAQLET